jgi:hypothetical protein
VLLVALVVAVVRVLVLLDRPHPLDKVLQEALLIMALEQLRLDQQAEAEQAQSVAMQ